MKKLTIITINFNHREGLQRTIDSIVNQTFTDYEWIVVDGGSTDGSRELLEKYTDHFAWWCSEPDNGVYNAMNKGIAHATGEYINFMNSGDIFATSTVLSEFFAQPRTADIIFGLMALEAYDGETVNTPAVPPRYRWWEFYNRGMGHQSEFAKRALFAERTFDETLRLTADWEWNAYFIAAKRVLTEFVPMVISRYEGGGMTDNQMEKLYAEREVIHQRYFASMCDDDVSELRYVAAVKRFKVTRALYYLLSRCANRWIRYKKSKIVNKK